MSHFSLVRYFRHYSFHLLTALKEPLLIFFAIAGNTITFFSSIAFYYFERDVNPQVSSWMDGMWWAFCTISTVGYGDIVPVTAEGRFVGMILIVTGILFFVGFTAILVTILSSVAVGNVIQREKASEKQMAKLRDQVTELKEQLDQIQSLIKQQDTKTLF